MTTQNKTRPTHRIYAVTTFGKNKKPFWQPIGALWSPHQDGKGFNLTLDYLPLNGAELVVREIADDEQDGETVGNGGAQ